LPKETFFNLPDSKKLLIEDAAVDEFAQHGYDNASINRIVDECHIAKGSFYQYFEDKKDLYKHLINRISEEKLSFVAPVLANIANMDLFTLLGEMYRAALAYGRSSIKAAMIGNQVYKNQDHPVHKEIIADGMVQAKALYANLLTKAIAKGEVRADIDLDFAVHMLISMNVSIFEYYFREVRQEDFNMSNFDDNVMDTVNIAIDFIKKGITH
jgi:AcrR family transcriptional regulator